MNISQLNSNIQSIVSNQAGLPTLDQLRSFVGELERLYKPDDSRCNDVQVILINLYEISCQNVPDELLFMADRVSTRASMQFAAGGGSGSPALSRFSMSPTGGESSPKTPPADDVEMEFLLPLGTPEIPLTDAFGDMPLAPVSSDIPQILVLGKYELFFQMAEGCLQGGSELDVKDLFNNFVRALAELPIENQEGSLFRLFNKFNELKGKVALDKVTPDLLAQFERIPGIVERAGIKIREKGSIKDIPSINEVVLDEICGLTAGINNSDEALANIEAILRIKESFVSQRANFLAQTDIDLKKRIASAAEQLDKIYDLSEYLVELKAELLDIKDVVYLHYNTLCSQRYSAFILFWKESRVFGLEESIEFKQNAASHLFQIVDAYKETMLASPNKQETFILWSDLITPLLQKNIPILAELPLFQSAISEYGALNMQGNEVVM